MQILCVSLNGMVPSSSFGCSRSDIIRVKKAQRYAYRDFFFQESVQNEVCHAGDLFFAVHAIPLRYQE